MKKHNPFRSTLVIVTRFLIGWYALGNQRKWYSRWSRWCVASSISLLTKGFVKWNSNGVYLYTYIQLLPFDYVIVFCSTSQLHLEERKFVLVHCTCKSIAFICLANLFWEYFLTYMIYIYFIIIAKELKLKFCYYLTKILIFLYLYLFFTFLSNVIIKNIDFFKIIRLLIFKIFLVFIIIARNKSFEGYVWSVLIDSIYL